MVVFHSIFSFDMGLYYLTFIEIGKKLTPTQIMYSANMNTVGIFNDSVAMNSILSG